MIWTANQKTHFFFIEKGIGAGFVLRTEFSPTLRWVCHSLISHNGEAVQRMCGSTWKHKESQDGQQDQDRMDSHDHMSG